MSDESNLLDSLKKDIRSVLLPEKNGLSLNTFLKNYKSLIGQQFPFRQFGYKSDIDFLMSMKDEVIDIVSLRDGNYQLYPIADESTQHIQNLVSKQKVSVKHKTGSFSSHHYTNLPIFNWSSKKNCPPRFFKKNSSPTDYVLPAKVKNEIIELVKQHKDGIHLGIFLTTYKKTYQIPLDFKMYGFSTLEDCIETIPELTVKKLSNFAKVFLKNPLPLKVSSNMQHTLESQMSKNLDLKFKTTEKYNFSKSSPEEKTNYKPVNGASKQKIICKTENETSNKFSPTSPNENIDESDRFCLLKPKFTKVLQHFPKGILATNFLKEYEKIIDEPLDVHDFGYYGLLDLVEALPDICFRKPLPGSKKDWIICAKTSSETNNIQEEKNEELSKCGTPFIEYIIQNIRKILEAHPEGINLKHFIHIYSINCHDTLDLLDLGFDKLENFLLSISQKVPLNMVNLDLIGNEKVVYLIPTKASSLPNNSALYHLKEAYPIKAAPPGSVFVQQSLPLDQDLSQYIPVYTSCIINPHIIWVQLSGGQTTQHLGTLQDKIENFYRSKESEDYLLKDAHLVTGTACISLWPSDYHYYRGEIKSIPSLDFVEIFYVDYGNTATVPRDSLRYIKKEFLELPAQAIKCELAFIKPVLKDIWPPDIKNILMTLCYNKLLMAHINEVKEDGWSVFLCDTTGIEDIHINDLLVKKGLAMYDHSSLGTDSPSLLNPALNPQLNTQLLQSQYLLQAAAIAAALQTNSPLSNNVPLGNALNTQLLQLQLTNLVASQLSALSPSLLSNLNSNPYLNASLALNNLPLPSPLTLLQQQGNSNNLPSCPPGFSKNPSSQVMPNNNQINSKDIKSTPETDDLFDEDDDEMFQKFCKEVASAKRRYVKLVNLSEGSRINIVIVNDKPFVSAGDISALLWTDKDADFLIDKLSKKEITFFTLTVTEKEFPDLFYQCRKYKVKGFKNNDHETSLTLFLLQNVIYILNIFGHPSALVRDEIHYEIDNLNLADPIWTEFHDEEIADRKIGIFSETDNDKIKKMCLYDLKIMLEGLRYERLQMQDELRRSNDVGFLPEEIKKNLDFQASIEAQIKKIEKIIILSQRKHCS